MKDTHLRLNLITSSIIVGIAVYVLISYASTQFSIANAQNMSNVTGATDNITLSKETNVHITKDTTIDYSIVEGVTVIGAFDNTYSITGDAKSLKDSKENVITTVQDDFMRSTAAGYIRAEGVTSALDGNASISSGNASSIANPFASPDTIKDRISSEISKSIDSISNMEFRLMAVHCDFDSLLTDWGCDVHPLFR
jgi:hypothetical protein